jgi:hypothetical protein
VPPSRLQMPGRAVSVVYDLRTIAASEAR